MTDTITVRGDKRMAATMTAAAADLGDMAAAAASTAQIIATAGRGRAPRRTGRLAGSVAASVARGGTAQVIASTRYAAVVHWGSQARHITAHPFLSDAATQTESTWSPTYAAAVQAALDQVKGV